MSSDTIFETIVKSLPEAAIPAIPNRFLAPRQILIVKDYATVSAGFQPSNTDTQPRSLFSLHLTGTPSSSSEVTSGYIHFTDVPHLKAPSWVSARKEINLWVDIRGIELVMAQMQHRRKFLWRGEFENGHIYGDLHSEA